MNRAEFETFLELRCGAQKPREGWLRRGITENVESIGAHSLKSARAGFFLASHYPGVDPFRLAMMLLFHDVAEMPEEGEDYIPGEISKEEKATRERMIMQRILPNLGHASEMTTSLLQELQENKTLTAQLAHQLDKLDAMVQALEYDRQGYEQVRDFYPYTLGKLSDPLLLRVAEVLLKKDYESWSSSYFRYYSLLALGGDEEAYHRFMRDVAAKEGFAL